MDSGIISQSHDAFSMMLRNCRMFLDEQLLKKQRFQFLLRPILGSDSVAEGPPRSISRNLRGDFTPRSPGSESRVLRIPKFRVDELPKPSTLSYVMKVTFLDGSRAFLKLYDHRFSSQLRSDHKLEPWNDSLEKSHSDFIASEASAKFLHNLRYNDDFEEPEEGWSPEENEVYLQDKCIDMFRTEFAIYEALKPLQGKQIPYLIAQVTLPTDDDCFEHSPQAELHEIKGVLLEYVDGFTLSELSTNAPREVWQNVVDQALRITHEISDHSILNTDVRPGNIMVTPDAKEQCGFRAVMIDFAQCRFRRETELDEEWGRAKWTQDEEGAIGIVMRSKLKKIGFDLHYEPSNRYAEWAEGE